MNFPICISNERIKNNIKNLFSFGATSEGGVTRLPFTEDDDNARNYLVNAMKEIGLDVRIDAVGSVIGRIEGVDPSAPTVIIGSHYDTVKNAGSLDGILGVVSGLEIAQIIKENNLKFKHSIEIMAINDEEGIRFGGGFLGSRALVGDLTIDELYLMKDEQNIALADAMIEHDFDPQLIYNAVRKKEDIKAFLELHIEQGPILDSSNVDIGIVTSIVGMQRYIVNIQGRPDHAGTTPMNMRLDALDASSKIIQNVRDWALMENDGAVATIGYFNVEPSAVNIVPSDVTFSIDVRAKYSSTITRIMNKITSKIEEICGKTLTFSITKTIDVKPVNLSSEFCSIIETSCKKRDYSNIPMVSGAGHDSLIMANFTEVGMIFVPSKNGRSHCPEEYTDEKYLVIGTEVLFDTLIEVARIIN